MDETASPKIAVLGAGLIGVYVGGLLRSAGADVTLVGRQRVMEELRANDLRITNVDGVDVTIQAEDLTLADHAGAIQSADLILLTVKSPATEEAALDIATFAKSGAVVLSLQNGVSNADRLRSALPQFRVVAGMVPFNVAQPGPGHYHRGTGGGLYAEAGDAIAPFAAVFAAAGLPLTLSNDMPGVMWGKLIINLNNAINVLSGKPLAAQFADRDFRRALAMSQIEALRLLRRAGIKPAQVLHVPTTVFPYMISLPDALYRRLAARSKAPRIDRHARSSMADDLAKGRKTEIDYLNGEVVALAQKLGRDAPINRRIIDLIRAAEAGAAPWDGAVLRAELRRARST